MEKEGSAEQDWYSSNLSIKLRNLEEKQQTLSERVLLIGENLIEQKEKTQETTTTLKKEVMLLKSSMGKMLQTLEMLQEDITKLARREDVDILAKQARMFQPLEAMYEGNK